MNGQKLLKRTLLFNAIFSTISGLDFILFDRSLLNVLTNGVEVSLSPIGVMLLFFASIVFLASRMQIVNAYLAWSIIAMDIGWVLASFVLIAARPEWFTFLGFISVIGIAIVIAVFAALQATGLRLHSLNPENA